MHRRRHYIYPDLDTLAAAFVSELNRFLQESSKLGRPVHIALSGGSTPLAVFRQLAVATWPEEWEHVHIWWGDERCVPADDPESNYGNAKEIFLDPLGFTGDRIHPIRGEEDPAVEAERYGRLLKDQLPVENGFPVFDWIWLGLGEDGHTASIFPQQIEILRSDHPCAVARHPKTKQKRVTITGGVINGARRVAFLVAGEFKSHVVNEIVMKEGNYMDYPAFYVSPLSENIEWYLDMKATSWM
ncbi:MAG: 6-phosphogluconolactonase [Bacteroidetes bacterium]|nr:6-phosphogluconolactonase [Bacteroidota bacterium]